jgi:tryptophan 2,3-dioxygenase
MSDPNDMPTSYWDYIRVENLLALQGGIGADEGGLCNDEVMFIVVHQIDELWFKLALRELESVRNLFRAEIVPEAALASAVRGLRRIESIFRFAGRHFELMETMTTRDFLSFRDKLFPASGFQSAQLRELEILLGLPDSVRVPLGHEGSYLTALRNADGTESPAYTRVEKRLHDTPSLREAVTAWLHRTPIEGSSPASDGDTDAVWSFVQRYLQAHSREVDHAFELAKRSARSEADLEKLTARYTSEKASARAFMEATDVNDATRLYACRARAAIVFIESYREMPLLAWPRELLDAIVSLEQAFVVFRQLHARMVERMLGRRTGTGGSAGVDYLDQTALRYRIFSDIWAARTLLIRKESLPSVTNEGVYAFSSAP